MSWLVRGDDVLAAAEVAVTRRLRAKGLMGREDLEGVMVLRPCRQVHTFGMQFPIDLVYLDRGLRIKKLRSSVAPWRLSACLSAHSILELPAGTIRESQSQPGDLLEFSPAEAKTVSKETK